jgi:hypothetical protein
MNIYNPQVADHIIASDGVPVFLYKVNLGTQSIPLNTRSLDITLPAGAPIGANVLAYDLFRDQGSPGTMTRFDAIDNGVGNAPYILSLRYQQNPAHLIISIFDPSGNNAHPIIALGNCYLFVWHI